MYCKKCGIGRRLSPVLGAALYVCVCLSFSGCIHSKEREAITAGEAVKISYACRLDDGTLVSATDPGDIQKLEADPFSVFIGPGLADNGVIRAGDQPLPVNSTAGDNLKDFQAVLKHEIGKQIVGKNYGETIGMSVTAEDTSGLSSRERFIRLASRRVRPKEKTVSLSTLSGEDAGGVPEVGKDMTRSSEPWLKGVISKMDDTSVTITYSADAGSSVVTPYGPGVISETDTAYMIDIKAVIGKPVRAGGFLGRITASDGQSFTVDFGNPLGGERIHCNVIAEAPSNVEKSGASVGVDTISNEPAETAIGKTATRTPSTISGSLASGPDAAACAVPPDTTLAGSAKQTAGGDLVGFDYTLMNQEGELVMTSRLSDDGDPSIKKSGAYEKPKSFGPAEIVLGNHEIVTFIEKALYGMKEGERKRLHLEPENAYGVRDPEKVRTFPRVKAIPEVIRISRKEFADRFRMDPQAGRPVQVVPLFTSEVASVEGDHVFIRHLVKSGTVVPGDMGPTKIEVRDQKVVMTLSPTPGVEFEANGERGMVSATEDDGFVVDFNPAHAGESFDLTVTLRSVVKNEAYAHEILWKKDLGEVLTGLGGAHKPGVLVLYAGWCGWSKKLITETLTDPRITSRRDRFIWGKIDSDQEKDIYDLYEQTSFPTIVLLKEDGEVIKKLEGFIDAQTLGQELAALTK